MEREACVCDHGYERSDLCAEIIIIKIIAGRISRVMYCGIKPFIFLILRTKIKCVKI